MSYHFPIRAVSLVVLLLWPVAAPADERAAYRAGMRIATQRGYANPDCYARVFVQHAARRNQPEGRTRYAAKTGRAFKGELWSRCGISR